MVLGYIAKPFPDDHLASSQCFSPKHVLGMDHNLMVTKGKLNRTKAFQVTEVAIQDIQLAIMDNRVVVIGVGIHQVAVGTPSMAAFDYPFKVVEDIPFMVIEGILQLMANQVALGTIG